ncbi:FliM/FliN family flagellar motor switch protein [Chelativorans sp. M5D2P16]|uniref:FliM/FliN family flagellar motor switch protein n=1 Tax=Chelativorans sp. M5D2P16 TaxID=3095678 RepID=UPI002ACAFD57|nr:FliM/FliN family flagellar motor switch protein [Chelativorans sp. M5D2P16]MDZ5698434.1 FliM/FliN family flagellar motor switch protein [Chelativorans sp. M5D2P16]
MTEMAAEAHNPEMMRKLIVERLVGATSDPRHVSEAARALATRVLPLVSETLADVFPTPLTVDLADIDIVRLADLKPEGESFDALVVVPALTSRDALTLRLDPQALSLLVSTFFGGDPDIAVPPLTRVPSRIELDVATMVFDIFAQAINGTGPRAFGLRLPVGRPLAGPRDFKRFIVRDGPGVCVTFTIGAGEEGGRLTAWMPQRVLMESRGPMNTRAPDRRSAAEWRQRFGGEVLRSKVELTATVPLTKVPLGALAELREGQVLELGANAQGETRLTVRGRPVFICEFGKLGQNYTVRVKQPFDARQDVLNGLLAG